MRIGPSETGTLSQSSTLRRSSAARARASSARTVGGTVVRPVQPTSIAGSSRGAELLQVGRALVAGVVGRHQPEHDLGAERALHRVRERHVRGGERAEGGAVLGVHQLGRHVVDAEREEARAERREGAQLLDERRDVGGVRVADREPGREREADLDAGVARRAATSSPKRAHSSAG